MVRDEPTHQFYAHLVVDDLQINATRPNVFFWPLKRDVFADDYLGDAVQKRGAAAHVTRRQR